MTVKLFAMEGLMTISCSELEEFLESTDYFCCGKEYKHCFMKAIFSY